MQMAREDSQASRSAGASIMSVEKAQVLARQPALDHLIRVAEARKAQAQ